MATKACVEPRAAGFVKPGWRARLDGWLRVLRAGLLLGFDAAVLRTRRKPDSRTQGAIFCLHGWGDLLLAGQAVARLAAEMRARGLQPVLFVHPALAEFARRTFPVDRVEGIDRHRFTRRFGYRAAILKSVAGRFALAVQPTYNRMLRVEDCLVRATGAPERIGSAGHAPFISPPERRLGDRFYTKLITHREAPLHELERHAEFMSGLGLAVSTEPWRLEVWREPSNGQPRAPDTAWTAAVPAGPYLVLSPNASDPRRSWPLENFLRAARQVATQHRQTVVVIGSEKPGAPLRWPGDSGTGPELVDLCGQIPTEDLPGLLAGAELVISNDSGIYHLGNSLGRPTVAVGGSGLPARYFPYPREAGRLTKAVHRPVPCAGCNWRCSHTSSRAETAWCLQQVTWQEVADAASELLQRKS